MLLAALWNTIGEAAGIYLILRWISMITGRPIMQEQQHEEGAE